MHNCKTIRRHHYFIRNRRAVMVIFNMAIGRVTPPMGTLMFVTCGITKCSYRDFIREAVPFFVLLFICLMLLAFVPFFSQGVVELFHL